MAEEEEKKYYITAAIDFGTTFSCYAFSFNDGERKREIIYNKNWGGTLNTESLKTPTFVLTDPEHNFHSFGYDAISHYHRLSAKERKDYNMYSNYKEALHATQSYYGPATITSNTGHERPAIEVFVMGLKYLKGHMLQAIRGEAPNVSDEDIQWVLCAPAIWSAPAKEFIRKVAHEAGLMKELHSDQLRLALEPEAAAIFCRSVEMNHFTKGPQQLDLEKEGNFRFTSGTKFVLIDAGGGTVDITAYQIRENRSLEELCPPSGGGWGGTRVDSNFLQLLCEILGEDFVTHFQENNPGPSLEMLINFQRAKLDIKTEKKSSLKIPIPLSLDRAYRTARNQYIEDVIKDKQTGVTYDDGSIVLPFEVVKSHLFDPPVKEIVRHVYKILEHGNLRKLDYIMLVGGFGQCELLQRAVFEAFKSKATVLLPLEAQVAVIRGAVRFGQDPYQVEIRRSAYTYGQNIYQRFIEGKHDESRRVIIDGEAFCRNCFRIYIKKEEPFQNGEVREFTSVPMYADQTSVQRRIYSTKNESPSYIDENGVHLVGELEALPMPDTELGKERTISTRVTFHTTEFTVEVTESTRDGSEIISKRMGFVSD